MLENIFRYMEMGMPPREAAEKGGMEVSLAVLAATFTTSIVFFPVTFLSGISKYIFTPLALGVVLSIFASYFFAMTVVPLYCAKFIRLSRRRRARREGEPGVLSRASSAGSTSTFHACSTGMKVWPGARCGGPALPQPRSSSAAWCLCWLVLFPFLGRAYFPRTDPGQFVINVRMPSGTRLEVSNEYIAKSRERHPQRGAAGRSGHDRLQHRRLSRSLRHLSPPTPRWTRPLCRPACKEDHSIGSYEYMRRVREKLSREMPELSTYFQAGGLVDGVINQGLPAPIDIQVSSMDMDKRLRAGAAACARRSELMPNVSDVYIPQDLDYPGLALNIDRERASLIGLSAQGCRGQRDHRPDLRRHGRPQLLDRSEERQQLHGHGAVRESLDQQHVDGGFQEHSACAACVRLDTARCRKPDRRRVTSPEILGWAIILRATRRLEPSPISSRSILRPKWTTTRFGA